MIAWCDNCGQSVELEDEGSYCSMPNGDIVCWECVEDLDLADYSELGDCNVIRYDNNND